MRKVLPRLIFWETTLKCNLRCPHCRGSAAAERSPEELNLKECRKFIDSVAKIAKPILVLSGGEPLVREDIYDIAFYANEKGLKPVLATNATLINKPVADKIKKSGIKRISVSIYGGSQHAHDNFCGKPGAFEKTLKGIEQIKGINIPVQINTTITRYNVDEIPSIISLAEAIGADAVHLFLLVPTGRGKALEEDEISAQDYEDLLNWLYDLKKKTTLELKATCAPHYFRIRRQRSLKEKTKRVETTSSHAFYMETKGCLAGSGVCFISYRGEVYGCGYLPVKAGSIKEQVFEDIWFNSELFNNLRDMNKLTGKCGRCEYKKICGGCRARAYGVTGDYLSEEPYCIYVP